MLLVLLLVRFRTKITAVLMHKESETLSRIFPKVTLLCFWSGESSEVGEGHGGPLCSSTQSYFRPLTKVTGTRHVCCISET